MKFKVVTGVAGAVALSLAIGAGAQAVPDLRSTYVGLVLQQDSVNLGQLYTIQADYTGVNIYGRYANDYVGDRLQVTGKVRDLVPSNGQAIYAQGIRWNNGLWCYPSGIGKDSVNVRCSSGTWNDDGTDDQYTYGNTTWIPYTFAYGRNGSMNSQRYELHVCEDQPLWFPDVCSGSRVLGIDWN